MVLNIDNRLVLTPRKLPVKFNVKKTRVPGLPLVKLYAPIFSCLNIDGAKAHKLLISHI